MPARTREKFTVIVLAADRGDTLADTLESCTLVADEDFSVVVSDNCSTDQSADVIREYEQRDSRIRGIRPMKRLSMAAHYEFALEHVRDGFAMVLGADDALMAGGIERARAALATHPEVLAIQGQIGLYYYPNFYGEDAGRLYLRTSPSEELADCRQTLERVASLELNVGDLPILYQTAFVDVAVLEQVRKKTGRVMHAITPDFFAGVAVASCGGSMVRVCPGFAISGMSVKSTGTSQLLPGADRTMEASFLKESEIGFHPLVPYSRCGDVILGDTILRAKEAGLLPDDLVIRWDRIVMRAYHEFQTSGLSADDLTAAMTALRTLSANMKVGDLLSKIEAYPSVREWIADCPELAVPRGPTWELVLDTRQVGARGVHDAAVIADSLIRRTNAPDPALVSGGLTDATAIPAWAMRESCHQLGELRRQVAHLKAESERRAAERDRAKRKVTELRAKAVRTRAEHSSPKSGLLGSIRSAVKRLSSKPTD